MPGAAGKGIPAVMLCHTFTILLLLLLVYEAAITCSRVGVYGAYLLAVYDDENETYQTISKLGTGFSEEQLQQLADSLRPHLLPGPKPYYQYGEGQAPDVWFDPVVVWEVKAADLSISPVHQAARGLVEDGKGISIRYWFIDWLYILGAAATEDSSVACAAYYNTQCSKTTPTSTIKQHVNW